MGKQILLIDYRANITKTLKLDLLKYFDISAVIREGIKDATNILEILPDVRIILTLNENPKEKTLDTLQRYIIDNKKNLELISYNSEETPEVIIQRVGDYIGQHVDHDRYQKDHSYVGYKDVPINFLKNIDESPVDLYVQIGEGADTRFIKRVNKLDPFSKSMVSDFLDKGILSLYVAQSDFELFMTSLTNAFVKGLTEPEQPIAKVIDAQFNAFEYLNSYASVLNFDKKIVEVVESTVDSYLEVLNQQKSLAVLIQHVVTKKATTNFQGFYLTCLLIYHIYKSLNRYQESKMQKMVMATLFCDLELDRKEVYLINSNTQLIASSDSGILTEHEVELVRSHARRNAESLRSYPELPLEVMTLVRQHHGSPEGIGFQDHENPQIQDDSLVLLCAHVFIKYFLSPEYKFDKKEILKILRERFPYERIRPYWDAIGTKIE